MARKKVPAEKKVSDEQPAARAGEHEATRRAYIKAETNIRSIGAAGVVFGIFCIAFYVSLALDLIPLVHATFSDVALVPVGLLSLAQGVLLRQLKPAGRTLGTVGAVIAVVAKVATSHTAGEMLPQLVGIVLFLRLLWSDKSSMVFSEHYRTVVIPATPHVKPKHGMVTIALLALLLVTVGGLIFLFAGLKGQGG